MNCQAVDLRKSFFNAVFELGRNVVYLRDWQASIHHAVARNENLVFNCPDVDVVAIRKLVILRGQ